MRPYAYTFKAFDILRSRCAAIRTLYGFGRQLSITSFTLHKSSLLTYKILFSPFFLYSAPHTSMRILFKKSFTQRLMNGKYFI